MSLSSKSLRAARRRRRNCSRCPACAGGGTRGGQGFAKERQRNLNRFENAGGVAAPGIGLAQAARKELRPRAGGEVGANREAVRQRPHARFLRWPDGGGKRVAQRRQLAADGVAQELGRRQRRRRGAQRRKPQRREAAAD